MTIAKTLIGVSLAALMAGSVSAENIAIIGGTAFTHGGSGKVENATVLIKDDKIVSVTAGGAVPEGYRTVDAGGKWVTPGFMVASSTLGLTEVSNSGGINDASAGKAKKSISLDVTDALNPDSTLIPNTRIEGVTRAVTRFSASKDMWVGQGAVIQLGNGDDLAVRPRAFVELNISENTAEEAGGSRAALWAEVYEKLDSAKPKSETKDEGDKKDKADKKPDAEMDALKRVFDGEASLLVKATRKADILKVIDLKARYGVDVILVGANEGWRVADKLAAAKISVVIDPIDNLPEDFETLGSTGANAARLHAAGVKIAFTGPDTHNARLVIQSAGNAVAMGLPWEAAVDALTINPAEMFGVAKSYGTLEAGKDADVVVWDGDPLEVMSSPDAVFIKGDDIPLVSRQTKLRDRYKDLTRAPAYKK